MIKGHKLRGFILFFSGGGLILIKFTLTKCCYVSPIVVTWVNRVHREENIQPSEFKQTFLWAINFFLAQFFFSTINSHPVKI